MHDYNLFADIKKLLIETKLAESHTTEEIKALSTSELKKLHKEYLEKDTEEAKEEAAEIKKEIESRGEEKDEDLNEATRFTKAEQKAMRRDWVSSYNKAAKRNGGETNSERLHRIAREKMAEKKAKAGKSDVAEQNEELLAILDTLCEMAGLDMMNLVELHASGEMTRDDFQNWLHAKGAGAKDKSTEDPRVAAARIKRAKETAKRIGTKSERIAREREQFRAGPDFAERMADAGQDNVHETDKGVVTGLKALRGFDQIQSDIDDLAHKSRRAEEGKKSEMSPTMKAHVENLRRLAKPAAKKTKGKGKQNKIGSMELFGFEKMQGNKPRGKGKKK